MTRIITIIVLAFICQIAFAQGKINRPVKAGNLELRESGKVNGHAYVDLALPSGTKWATCNLGASKPSDFGGYFSWGDVQSRNSFYADGSFKGLYPSIIKKSIGGDYKSDAATSQWGARWRMPSVADFEELKKYCNWQYKTINGHNGYLVTGTNGNSIFFPLTGGICGTDNALQNKRAVYRTADCHQTTSMFGAEYWESVCFTLEENESHGDHRKCDGYPETNGFSIRPITK